MATTTNYGWDTPDDTDLVKDGASAIRTLGSSIDTTTKNLNPQTTTGALAYRSATANVNTALPIGTAGQILAVSGGVPAWINNDQGDITEVQAGTGISVASGTGPVPIVTNTVATAIDAKGDLIVGTGADAFSRLAVGTNDFVLTAASGEATGLKWAAAASSSGPAFKARRTSDQNVASANTWTKVQFNSDVFDTDNCYDATTNYRFTPTKAGYYQFNTKLYFPINTNYVNNCAIYKNGSAIARSNAGVSVSNGAMGGPPGVSDLQAANGTTDYFEVYAISSSSGNDIGGGAEDTTYFSGVWIRGL